MTGDPTSQPILDAIARGLEAVGEMGHDRDAFRLVQVTCLVLSKDADPARWQLDFKSRDTIPDRRGGKVGKGGELRLVVDVETGQIERLRRGD
jgi:hypothetical protein